MLIWRDISVFFSTFVPEMKKTRHIIWCLILCVAQATYAQSFSLDDVLEDIYNQLEEDNDIVLESVQEELLEIAANPINLNHTNADELSRLRFLSDEQIDAILLYQYEHCFKEIYELQLIDCLKDYDIRNLLPFVYIGKENEQEKLYVREVFHYAKHEVTLRTDARDIESNKGDPLYGKLRYRFNYQNKVQAGLSIVRHEGSNLNGKKWDYGGYIQLNDLGKIKTLVAGDYQATYGYGLVVGSPFKWGKTAYIQSTATTDEGLKKLSSIGDGYNGFHGIGMMARMGKKANISTFYSLQNEKNNSWNHVVGVNVTSKWKKIKVGVTAIENISKPTQAHVENDIKNEPQSEKRETNTQALIGANARYNYGKIDLWGEVAVSQGTQWGIAGITGMRYTPVSDVNLLAIYRYYSPYYSNPYANALCSWSRMRDEHGGYIGLEYNKLKNWQLSTFVDVWKNGYEVMAQGDWLPKQNYHMHMRFRVKDKDEACTYSLRWNMAYQMGRWKMKTQADGNLVKGALTYGWSVLQDVEYRFSGFPIVVQMRAQFFDAREWTNRIYIYEHDVLYAYAMPFVYGIGGRFLLNARYKINDTFSLYLRLSETVYQRAWAAEQDKKRSRTDVHALVRVKL